MKLIVAFFSHFLTLTVIAALAGFVVYSLYFYKPSVALGCSTSVVAEQTDVAIHVVRQWFGKDGADYTPCPVQPVSTQH